MVDKSSGSFTPKGGHPISGRDLTGPDDCSVGCVVDTDVQLLQSVESAADSDKSDFVVLRHPWDIMK
jgi:hypothetical protein